MNSRIATAWVLAAGMWVAGVRGQEGVSTNTVGKMRGINLEEVGNVLAFPGEDWTSDGRLIFRIDVVAGEEYTVFGKPSLLDDYWMPLTRWVADTSGEVSVEVESNGAHFFCITIGEEEGEGMEVLSANAVGYTTFTIPAGGKQMVSIPFENLTSDDGSFRFGETQIARDLATGSVVYFWNAERQIWDGGMKSAFGWDPAEANHMLQPGEGFAVMNSSDAIGMEVSVGGEVPSAPALIRDYAGGDQWNIMANPYPIDVKFGDTELASELPIYSQIMFWDPAAQGWSSWTKGKKGWTAATSNHVVECGESFFIKTSSEGKWEVVKPYTWP